MDLINPEISDYAGKFTTPESACLSELNRETFSKVLMPRMLSGHLQGRILSMISKLMQPERILEIGTYTGYSAICLAEGLKDGGVLHTIDTNDELKPMIDTYIQMAGMENKINTHFGKASDIIPQLNENYDLVFIDADKINYGLYYDLIFDRVKKGGLIIADNVLWSGKVIQSSEKMDKDTRAIHAFNEKIQKDDRVENLLLPVRDGLMFILKK